jgi:hypothetical protein
MASGASTSDPPVLTPVFNFNTLVLATQRFPFLGAIAYQIRARCPSYNQRNPRASPTQSAACYAKLAAAA